MVELSRHDAAFALDLAAGNALGLARSSLFGTEDQKRRYAYPPACSGELLGGWALTEPEAGSDSGGMRTEARPNADGSWTVNGHKMYITQGRKADALVVMAATGVTAAGKKEISAFIVEKDQIIGVRKIPTFGMRASETSELKFEQRPRRTPRRRARPGPDAGADRCWTAGRIGVASVSASASRTPPLRSPSATPQSATSSANRSRNSRASRTCSPTPPWTSPPPRACSCAPPRARTSAARRPRRAAIAKLHASEAGSRVCNRAMQILGGRGYSREFPVERLLRDAKLCEIGEGASEIQRMVIARNVIKEHDARLAGELAAAGGLTVETTPSRETAVLAGAVNGR